MEPNARSPPVVSLPRLLDPTPPTPSRTPSARLKPSERILLPPPLAPPLSLSISFLFVVEKGMMLIRVWLWSYSSAPWEEMWFSTAAPRILQRRSAHEAVLHSRGRGHDSRPPPNPPNHHVTPTTSLHILHQLRHFRSGFLLLLNFSHLARP